MKLEFVWLNYIVLLVDIGVVFTCGEWTITVLFLKFLLFTTFLRYILGIIYHAWIKVLDTTWLKFKKKKYIQYGPLKLKVIKKIWIFMFGLWQGLFSVESESLNFWF